MIGIEATKIEPARDPIRTTGRARFWVRPEHLEQLSLAPQICYLIGGYDGWSNYGDVLQLITYIKRLEQNKEGPLGVPLIDARAITSHHDLARQYPDLFGDAPILYYALGDTRDDELQPLAALDLFEVERPPVVASQILVYGGGFLVERHRWGAQKLDLLEAIEQWLRAVSSEATNESPLLITGQQVSARFLRSAQSARFKELIRRADAFGARDDVSLEVVAEELGTPVGEWLFLSGDDAAPAILDRAWRRLDGLTGRGDDAIRRTTTFTLGVHVSFEEYVTEDPDSLLKLASSLVRTVHRLVGDDLEVNLLVAFEDRRISEGAHVERLKVEISDLGVPVNVIDVFGALWEGADSIRDLDLVVACSYHVGLTALLLAVPTLLLVENDCYGHKVEGLRRTLRLPDEVLLDVRRWTEDQVQERLELLATNQAFRVRFSRAAAGGLARMTLANATTATRVEDFFRGERVAELESTYRWTVDELRQTMERLSDLQLEYSRLLNAGDESVSSDETEEGEIVVYVVGGAIVDQHLAVRPFPLVNRKKGESKGAHLARVTQLVGEAIGAGGTHLLVPREQADWLGDHPRVAAYFAQYHELVEASDETGLVFTLYPSM